MDSGWIWIWILLLISAIPFQLLVNWMQNRFSQSVGVLFKQRMIYGILKMDVDELRRMGSGQMLDRVMEIEAVELLVLGGGLSALISFFQLVIAAWVLSLGSSGVLSVAILALWMTALIGAGWLNYQSGKKWSSNYRSMTNDMVEKMIGHRTRLAQEDPINRHEEEDRELVQYQALSHDADRAGILLDAIPASWLVAGLACLIPSLLTPQPAQLTQLAVGLGGVMFAYQAFETIRVGIQNDIQLLLSWEQVKPLYQAASRVEETARIAVRTTPDQDIYKNNRDSSQNNHSKPLLTMHRLIYRYHLNSRPALDECNLQIFPGNRLILEGPSGGGKTTLAAVMAGLRRPESGAILLHGYDLHSLGEATWRRQVMMAPQFHENYIFNETFAFNLLMGKRWPPQPEDIQKAGEICRELGLGDLLERMPSGWQQMLGESGWQLSHGERSRVFIARALLQNADLVIMDESFGALDPENLYRALECAYRRAATLLIIAHP
jgi:ATP-binding cassette subfamily B protein